MESPTSGTATDAPAASDRRNAQAGALRALFGEQWRQLLDRLGLDPARAAPSAGDAALVDAVVSGTDPRLRAVPRYRRRLRESTRATLDHVSALVTGLPPPLAIARDRFVADPRVNALFSSTRVMAETLGADRRLREHFAATHAAADDHVHFSLLVRRTEKTVFGTGRAGELLVRDVMQTQVSFDDHAVVAPAASEAQVRAHLERYLFDRLVAHFKLHMARLTTDEGYRGPPRRMGPDAYLDELVRLLGRPGEHLALRREQIVVSRLGVRLEEGSPEAGNALELHELCIGQRAPSVVILARYPRAEMLSKCELEARERDLIATL